MTLKAPEDPNRPATLSPVLFPHSLHFGYACTDCHHTWDGASAVQSCAASGCHENLWAPMPGEVPLETGRVKSLTGAYHQVCRSCHRQVEKDQKAAGYKRVSTGPIACVGCHPNPHSDPESSTESLSVPLGNIVIEPPEAVDAKKGAVTFPHGLHFQFSCQDCHHDWDGESEVEGCMASGCHDEFEPSGTRDIRDPDNVLYYLAAYHNVCIGCHRDLEAAAKEQGQAKADPDAPASVKKAPRIQSGPVGCTGCHS